MTLYRTTRVLIEDINTIVAAKVLPDGGQIIEHADLRIPVSVKGNEVTVLVNRATGELEHGWVCGFRDFMDLRVDAFRPVTHEDSPTLQPKDRSPALRFNGDREVVWVERYDSPPEVRGEHGY